MWEATLPDLNDQLRQGDLLLDVPFPSGGVVRLSSDGVQANIRPARPVVAIEQCCTIAQKRVVTLAEVGRTKVLVPGDRYLAALQAQRVVPNEPYTMYEHLLDAHPSLPADTGRYRTIRLLSRITLVLSEEELAELRTHRVARMDPLSRARLRSKLAVLFSSVEDDDRDWLADRGLDSRGEPFGTGG